MKKNTGMQGQLTYSRRVNGTGLPLGNLWDDLIGMLVMSLVLLVVICVMLQITLQLITTTMPLIAEVPNNQFARFPQLKAIDDVKISFKFRHKY